MSLYIATLLVSVLIYSSLYLAARQINKPTLGDHFWGIGFIIIAGFCFLYRNFGYTTGANWQISDLCYNQPLKFIANCPKEPLSLSTSPISYLPAILMGILITIWAIRLSRHTLTRSLHNALDWRYANWRLLGKRTSDTGIFFQKYLLQAGLLWIVSLPLQFMFTIEYERENYHENFIFVPVLLGTIVWLIGFVYELIADHQLKQFNKHTANHGKILQHGLWKYSRHPNYFGEITMWWGIFIICFAAPIPALWLPLSPLIITYMIRFVSGVPVLEKRYAKSKAYQSYKQRTNTLIPWFRKV